MSLDRKITRNADGSVSSLSDKLDEAIDYGLSRLMDVTYHNAYSDSGELLSLKSFGAIWPLGWIPNDLADDILIFGPDSEQMNPSVLWPIDISLAIPQDDGTIQLMHVQTISPRELRGKVSNFAQHIVKVSTAFILRNGTYTTEVNYFGYLNKKWSALKPIIRMVTYNQNGGLTAGKNYANFNINVNVTMAMSVALTRRYMWEVTFQIKDSPTLLFLTNPSGIRELFQNRDVPVGENRKKALRNWVRAHTRELKNSQNEEDIVFVRRHFRGKTSFDWQGYSCTITPSEYDLEKYFSSKETKQ